MAPAMTFGKLSRARRANVVSSSRSWPPLPHRSLPATPHGWLSSGAAFGQIPDRPWRGIRSRAPAFSNPCWCRRFVRSLGHCIRFYPTSRSPAVRRDRWGQRQQRLVARSQLGATFSAS